MGQIGVWARKGKNKKFPSPKRGCPEKEGLRQVSGWNIHVCSSFCIMVGSYLDIHPGTLIFLLIDDIEKSVRKKKWYTATIYLGFYYYKPV